MSTSFLDQFLDVGVKVEPGAWNAVDEEFEQKSRLLRECVVTLHAKSMKRRLGQDASAAELSADKKIGKMVYNRLLTCFLTWGGQEADVTELYQECVSSVDDDESHDLIVRGAQLDYDKFWTEKKEFLKLRVRFVANNAVANNDRKNGNRYANRFVNEYNSVGDVLDPVDTSRDNKFAAI